MAYLFQDSKQKKNLGKKAPWYVGWTDLADKQHKKKVGPKSMAKKFVSKVESDMIAGLCGENRVTWKQFREQFEVKILSAKRLGTQKAAHESFSWFESLCRPKRISNITTETVDEYRAKLRLLAGKKRGSTMSPATVNKHLRHLKVSLRKAHRWGYLPRVPEFEMEREPVKLVRYVTAEHFGLIFQHANAATKPKGLPYDAAEWWRALLMFCYMTGWRISEPLALTRDDLDLDNGTAVTRHDDNKGNRDELVPLHSVVIEHLRRINSFQIEVFPWYHDRSTLDSEFHRIQRAAGIHLPCREKHEHSPACHAYGFHDLRRAFATVNAPRLSADDLQGLMRHKSYLTTKRYISMATRLDDAVDQLQVPTLPKVQVN